MKLFAIREINEVQSYNRVDGGTLTEVSDRNNFSDNKDAGSTREPCKLFPRHLRIATESA